MPSNSSLATRYSSQLWPLVIALIALWLPVFYRLSFFWETNDQYSHGWFVPLLAGWIFYTRWQTLPPAAPPPSAIRYPQLAFSPWSLGPLVLLSPVLLLLAGSYLIAEANPNWRMMMWIMAGSAFFASLVLTQLVGGTAWTKHLWFAFFFALVSVPWPYSPEKWLTLELSMLAARVSTAILTLAGIPAVCVGNTIEVSVGVLGVDEACSGIRSFQSSLMAGLFLGELYMLRFAPRVILCLVGLVVAYGLNIARMLVLAIAVESSGTMDAISQWHDPAGFAILLLTMAILWALCALAAKFPGLVSLPSDLRPPSSDLPSPSSALGPLVPSSLSPSPATRHSPPFTAAAPLVPSSLAPSTPSSPSPLVPSSLNPSPATRHSPPFTAAAPLVPSSLGPLVPSSLAPSAHLPTFRLSYLPTIAVVAAMLLTAIGTEAWFRYKESQNLVKIPDWGVTPLPEGSSIAEDKPLPPYVKRLLGQDIGFERSWTDGKGHQWHLIFLRWLPGNMQGEGAPHAPDACQTGHGRKITARSEERMTEVQGIPLPYRIYTIDAGGSTFHLMYVLNAETFAGERPGGIGLIKETHRTERLRRVAEGRRRIGNRSMQLALVGESDAQAAEQAMLEILPTLIQRND